MEPRQEHTHVIEHFGFDPVSSTTRTKDQTKEDTSGCNPSADIQNLSYEVATKLSFDKTKLHNVSKVQNCEFNSLNSSFKLPAKGNTHMADDFWGFDPPINLGQGPTALRETQPYPKHDKVNTSGKPGFQVRNNYLADQGC